MSKAAGRVRTEHVEIEQLRRSKLNEGWQRGAAANKFNTLATTLYLDNNSKISDEDDGENDDNDEDENENDNSDADEVQPKDVRDLRAVVDEVNNSEGEDYNYQDEYYYNNNNNYHYEQQQHYRSSKSTDTEDLY
uniref:Uncharacterized protein n=1 Tax=Ceratitis capitata TaxID=7213 RepID=W8AK91_CERCA